MRPPVQLDPRIIQKFAAAAVATVGCVAAFHACSADQAAAISTTIAAIAALWEPKNR